jgi:hypothetical protein
MELSRRKARLRGENKQSSRGVQVWSRSGSSRMREGPAESINIGIIYTAPFEFLGSSLCSSSFFINISSDRQLKLDRSSVVTLPLLQVPLSTRSNTMVACPDGLATAHFDFMVATIVLRPRCWRLPRFQIPAKLQMRFIAKTGLARG